MEFKQEKTSLTVIMLTLNEGHNLIQAIKQLENWAAEIFVLDSFSSDDTIKILKKYNIVYKQKKFISFGNQWNYALKIFNIKSKFTMKLDPDERLTEKLKIEILENLKNKNNIGYYFDRVLYFMGKELPLFQEVT